MALFWSSRGRPSVCANSCGLLVGINKEQPSHSSSSLYPHLYVSVSFISTFFSPFIRISLSLCPSRGWREASGAQVGLCPPSKPLGYPKNREGPVITAGVFQPRAQTLPQPGRPIWGPPFSTWLHPLHKVSHPSDLGRWMAIGEPFSLCGISHTFLLGNSEGRGCLVPHHTGPHGRAVPPSPRGGPHPL